MDRQSLCRWLTGELDGAEASIDSGRSLPNSLQSSEALLAFEKQHVFENRWNLAGRIGDWSSTGAKRVLTVGRVPVVVVRDADDTLRAFVNLCQHRGHPLVDSESTGTGRLMVCRYHSWSYDLRGKLVRAPGLETHARKDCGTERGNGTIAEDLALQPVSLAVWRGLVFVSLSENPPALADEMLPAEAGPTEAEFAAYRLHHREVLHYTADWKKVYDNVVECYHCAGVHSNTLERMYRSEGFHDAGWRGNCRYATAQLRDFSLIHHSIQLFPGALLFFDPVVGLMLRIRPETPDLTAVEVTYLTAPDADSVLAERYVTLWSETLAEDRSILAEQHAALASGSLPYSRLVPGREDAVIGLQKLILATYRLGLAALR